MEYRFLIHLVISENKQRVTKDCAKNTLMAF